jgi:Spy/CpxP family protein refolding chaperone
MKKVMVAMVVLVALVVSAPAFAGDGKDHGKGMRGFLSLLSADQQKQAKAFKLDFLKKTEPIRAAVGKKKIELKELAYKDNPDENALQKKKEEIWALKDQLRTERRALKKDLRALLTPDQRGKIGPSAPKLGGKSKHSQGRGHHDGHHAQLQGRASDQS